MENKEEEEVFIYVEILNYQYGQFWNFESKNGYELICIIKAKKTEKSIHITSTSQKGIPNVGDVGYAENGYKYEVLDIYIPFSYMLNKLINNLK